MNSSRRRVFLLLVAALSLLTWNVTLRAASKPQAAQSTGQTDTAAKPNAQKKATGDTPATAAPAAAPAKAAPARQTPPANSNGMVWVNTDSGVYHKPGSRYYGKTKQGKYMSEADAIKAGYHASQRN
jgi:hypothetical protein